jgi:hypothetical protein
MILPKPTQLLVAAFLFAGFAQAAFADGITHDTFDISGTVYVTNAKATPVVTPAGTCPANTSCMFWQDASGTTTGKVDISVTGLPNGDIPAAIAGNDAANVASLQDPPAVVGSAISVPFMTFNNGGVTTTLTLTEILPGIFSSSECGAAPIVGQVCTQPGSPFNFVNNPPAPGQATMTWAFEGIGDAPGVTWLGNFTSQFGTPFQEEFGNLATNGYIDSSFSATMSLSGSPTAAPEPGTIVLFTVGVGSLLLFRRRAFRADSRQGL